MLLGLISDTHGLLRPAALDALQGVTLILHAGDVGDPKILDQLRTIAPVFAIRGNVDTEPWADSLPETTTIDVDGHKIYLIHDVNDIAIDPASNGIDIVLSGHSHQPRVLDRYGVLYINPGSAGPRRFQLPVTVARLDLAQRPWQVDFVDLMKQ